MEATNFFHSRESIQSGRRWYDIFFPKIQVRKDDIIIPSDAQSKFIDIQRELASSQQTLTRALKTMFSLADKQKWYMMWAKNENAEYIFANKKLRESLFDGVKLSDVYGKTDNELIEGIKIPECVMQEVIDITPETLSQISDKTGDDVRVCNLTDLITRAFMEPCKFVEFIGDYALVVWKYPMIREDRFLGTVGYGLDMSHESDRLMEKCLERLDAGTAYRIDSIDSFYLTDVNKVELSVEGVI